MALDNLRAFVGAIDAAGQLARVERPVSVAKEITEIADRCLKSSAFGAVGDVGWGHHARPGVWYQECGDVSRASARQERAGDALAAAQSGRGALARDGGAR